MTKGIILVKVRSGKWIPNLGWPNPHLGYQLLQTWCEIHGTFFVSHLIDTPRTFPPLCCFVIKGNRRLIPFVSSRKTLSLMLRVSTKSHSGPCQSQSCNFLLQLFLEPIELKIQCMTNNLIFVWGNEENFQSLRQARKVVKKRSRRKNIKIVGVHKPINNYIKLVEARVRRKSICFLSVLSFRSLFWAT